MTPRDYQQAFHDDAVAFLSSANPGDKRAYSAPTGSGKTLMQLMVRESLPVTLVSPTDDILAGFAEKLGKPGATKRELEKLNLWTPIRLRNELLKGTITPPKHLVIDELHHDNSDTMRLLDDLCLNCPAIGLTATPYRGTAKSTSEFRRRWGNPVVVITLKECVDNGFISFPECSVIPLLDDDVIEVRNGEFVVEQVDQQCEGVMGRLLGELDRLYNGSPTPDRPTMLVMPSVAVAQMYAERMERLGIPCDVVTGETKDRREVFKRVVECKSTLIQVKVVSEGVDLPLRRCIDMTPTMSPVAFMQSRIGRITRPVKPGESPPEYICTNRNLIRHAYLLEGLLPPSRYVEAVQAFGKPSSRRATRILGFEGLGKFVTSDIPLRRGTTGTLVCVTGVEGNTVTNYAAIASPLHSEVFYAKQVNLRKPDGTVYGKWLRCAEIPDLSSGFASMPARPVSEKQLQWWKNAAKYYGLDEETVPNARVFSVLPIMRETGMRFRFT